MEVEHLLGPKLMFADIQRRTKWYASKAKPLPSLYADSPSVFVKCQRNTKIYYLIWRAIYRLHNNACKMASFSIFTSHAG